MSNKLIGMAREILAIESDLPCRFNYKAKTLPTINDFDIFIFEQIWGSTALGFGGCGGSAMTTARTYVFVPKIDEQKCFVYFAGEFAYAVEYSEKFMEDVHAGQVASVMEVGKYSND